MNAKINNATVAVVVARFQVPYLTEAHRELIQTALNKHPKVLIFLGLSSVRGSINDPLDFQPRKQMILEEFPHTQYPNLHVAYIKDMRNDEDWSKQLDGLIRDQLAPNDKVVMYGSRDSFIPHYKGSFTTVELEQTRDVSGSELRAQVSQAPQSDRMFRIGAIWATYQRFPTVYSTVDVIVFNPTDRKILLGRKPNEKFYRMVGGFTDPKDNSFEDAAFRELFEETCLTVQTLGYVGSQKVDDWRYRSNPSEKIITHLYVGTYSHGCAKASDDIAEVRWFNYDGFDPKVNMVEEHMSLFEKAKKYIDVNYPGHFKESVETEIKINESFRKKVDDVTK